MKVFLAALLFLQPFLVLAQFDAGGFIETGISIESQPLSPQPGEEVTLTLNDYGGSHYGASLEWAKDSVAIPNTANQRSITVTAPPVGVKQTISLTLKAPNNETLVLKKVLSPVYVDIIVEPQTHVPGFYQGRALPSAGSTINLIALLNDGSMLSNNYVYTWRINTTVLEGGPLWGRNRISFVAPQDREFTISVNITTTAGELVASRSIYIPAVQPVLYFYEVNALYGINTRAITSDFIMIANASEIKAEPYYLDSNTFNSPDIFEWRINNKKVSVGGNDPYTITLEKTGQVGEAAVSLHVRSTAQLLQGARGGFTISL
jgi:hypothetical protein